MQKVKGELKPKTASLAKSEHPGAVLLSKVSYQREVNQGLKSLILFSFLFSL